MTGCFGQIFFQQILWPIYWKPMWQNHRLFIWPKSRTVDCVQEKYAATVPWPVMGGPLFWPLSIFFCRMWHVPYWKRQNISNWDKNELNSLRQWKQYTKGVYFQPNLYVPFNTDGPFIRCAHWSPSFFRTPLRCFPKRVLNFNLSDHRIFSMSFNPHFHIYNW